MALVILQLYRSGLTANLAFPSKFSSKVSTPGSRSSGTSNLHVPSGTSGTQGATAATLRRVLLRPTLGHNGDGLRLHGEVNEVDPHLRREESRLCRGWGVWPRSRSCGRRGGDTPSPAW